MVKKGTRALFLVTAVALMLTLFVGASSTVLAADAPEPVCAHEIGQHNEACGFVAATEGTPCANAETEPDCTHEGDCGYTPANPGMPCNHTVHDETCGGLATLQLEEEPAPAASTITGFTVAEVKAPQGTPEAELGLPSEVTATVQPAGEGAQPTTVKVGVGKWLAPLGAVPYDPADKALITYLYEADSASLSLPEGVALPEGVDMPCARVTLDVPAVADVQPMATQQIGTSTTSWDLTDGTLTISGTGAMPDFVNPSDAPWYSDVSSITTVTVSEGVTAIGANAFVDCANMIHATIPNGVTSIGASAFENAGKLKFITFEGETLPAAIGAAFTGTPSIGTVFVPAGKEADYAAALTGKGLDLAARRWEIKEIAYGLYLHTDGVLYMEKDPDPAVLDRPAVQGVDYTGTYTANSEGSVLTLDNFSFSTNASNVLYLRRNTTIELVGDNTLTGTGSGAGPRNGIRIYGSDLTIKNKKGASGSLTVISGESSTGDSTGILSTSFTLESGTVAATGGAAPLGSSGVIAYGAFTMKSGELTAKSGVTSGISFGMYVARECALKGGTITAQTKGKGATAAALFLANAPTGTFTVRGGATSADKFELVRSDTTRMYVLKSDGKTVARYATTSQDSEPEPPAPTPDPPAPAEAAPQTGDSSNMAPWLALLALAGVTICGSLLLMRKKRKADSPQ